MWRPKDWKNPHIDPYFKDAPYEGVFEAGADAMLKALHKEGEGKWFRFDKTDSGDILIYREG